MLDQELLGLVQVALALIQRGLGVHHRKAEHDELPDVAARGFLAKVHYVNQKIILLDVPQRKMRM